MATWRCPHCGTSQQDGSRCWVCSKSPTTCSNCRHFHHGVVAGIGLCAVDRTRTPIHADDVRACWQAQAVLDPPRGLFAMVEALESTNHLEATGARESDEGATGHDWLRRFVFSGRSGHSPEPAEAEPDASTAEPATANEPRDSDVSTPQATSFAGPPPPPRGQLHDAQTVSPALRLGYRGDARTLKDAALDAANHRSPRIGAR